MFSATVSVDGRRAEFTRAIPGADRAIEVRTAERLRVSPSFLGQQLARRRFPEGDGIEFFLFAGSFVLQSVRRTEV